MKTTLDIAEPLLEEAQALAAREGVSRDGLVEQGLRRVVAEKRPRHFKLKKASFKGKGLQSEFEKAEWSQIRAKAYEGRGG